MPLEFRAQYHMEIGHFSPQTSDNSRTESGRRSRAHSRESFVIDDERACSAMKLNNNILVVRVIVGLLDFEAEMRGKDNKRRKKTNGKITITLITNTPGYFFVYESLLWNCGILGR
jgi:hypothetical protein